MRPVPLAFAAVVSLLSGCVPQPRYEMGTIQGQVVTVFEPSTGRIWERDSEGMKPLYFIGAGGSKSLVPQ